MGIALLSSNKPLLWLLVVAVFAIPIAVWGDYIGWQISYLSTGLVFPLLGLLAFSLMWLQMAIATLFRGIPTEFRHNFHFWGGWIFLALIIAHPFLLAATTTSVSGGFSIGDLFGYVAEDKRIFVGLAITAWIIFIAHRFVRRAKHWRHFSLLMEVFKYLNYVGFFLIYFHSINLGSHLQVGLLPILWHLYALTALIFIYRDLRGDKLV